MEKREAKEDVMMMVCIHDGMMGNVYPRPQQRMVSTELKTAVLQHDSITTATTAIEFFFCRFESF